MFHNFNGVTCSVKILVATRGRQFLGERLKEQLEKLSSIDMPIIVEDWYESKAAGKLPEQLECCAFVLITEEFLHKAIGDSLSVGFDGFMKVLVGKASPLVQETVIFLLMKERILLRTLCDAFSLEPKDMVDAARENNFSYFSLSEDFVHSRYRKGERDFALRTHELLNAEPLEMAESETNLDEPERFILVVDSDKDQADGLQSFLTHHAKQQNVDLKVCVRHSVADAIRCMEEIVPLVISVRPNLTEQWDGLEIMSTAKQYDIPVVVRSKHGTKQIQGALNQRRIVARPTKVVSEDLLFKWAEAMMACLTSPTQH